MFSNIGYSTILTFVLIAISLAVSYFILREIQKLNFQVKTQKNQIKRLKSSIIHGVITPDIGQIAYRPINEEEQASGLYGVINEVDIQMNEETGELCCPHDLDEEDDYTGPRIVIPDPEANQHFFNNNQPQEFHQEDQGEQEEQENKDEQEEQEGEGKQEDQEQEQEQEQDGEEEQEQEQEQECEGGKEEQEGEEQEQEQEGGGCQEVKVDDDVSEDSRFELPDCQLTLGLASQLSELAEEANGEEAKGLQISFKPKLISKKEPSLQLKRKGRPRKSATAEN